MNILVIGNGFDLAHGLPTKYTDFLFFCKVINCIIEDNEIDRKINKRNTTWLNSCGELSFKNIKNNNDYIYKLPSYYPNTERDRKVYNEIIDNFIKKCLLGKDKDQKLIKEVLLLISDNFWIGYFLQYKMHQKENWIDFESEISKVIQSLDNDRSKFDFENNVQLISNIFLKRYYDANSPITYKQLRDKLLSDLNRLIRAFEIYLTEYVEKIGVEVVSPDIKNIAAISYDDRGQKGILFSKVISFNYTNIYEQIYLNRHNIDSNDYIDYIHGKADSNNKVESNNMVLGIDEYLEENKQNTQVEFIAFKKFYQRIYKETGCKYKEWVDTIKEEFADYQIELEKSKTEKNIMNLKSAVNKLKKQYLNKHHIYFFGHSLDVTDKDILRDLILNDNVHTTIFYHNKDVMGQQIANLVKVIGQDELIRRTGGNAKTIEFKLQQPMVPIDSQ